MKQLIGILLAMVFCLWPIQATYYYASGATSTLNNGLVAYWKLDEASGARADSNSTNTLTDNNTVTSDTGKISNAGKFAALNSELLSIADNTNFFFTSAFSFSCWVYSDDVSIQRSIAGKWTFQTDGGWQFGTDFTTSTNMQIVLATVPDDNGGGCWMTYASGIVDAATWYHFVIVFDGTLSGDANRLKLYKNGSSMTQSVFAGAVPSTLLNDTADFNLGKWGGSLNQYFNGRIDEVGLWNRALTSAEVTELYNATAGKTCCPFAP